ncbi:hypothetical protein SAMN05421505_102152 [Sinosporangium album]|uniref:Uncharacterized protein n=1 Tax=Sinosporangium album TaxID=504805 RepID=A0A1G7S3C0_9ACTN|nr:hypothetical protein [Sinosporangium album]SDG17557.1 hypothetical protein SAMN05421505_102152 [Sinosporangium album]
MGQRGQAKYPSSIPGRGLFIVGVDIAPGEYVCDAAKGGHYVRYPGGGRAPILRHPGARTPTRITIESDDTAFESAIPGTWTRVSRGESTIEDFKTANGTGPALVVAPETPEHVAALLHDHRHAVLDELRGKRVAPRTRMEMAARMAADFSLAPVSSLTIAAGIMLNSGFGAVLSIIGGAGAAIGMSLFIAKAGKYAPRAWREIRAITLARTHRPHLLLAEDFTAECAELLARTQHAIESVRSSRVAQAGLLDTHDTRTTLADQEWEIAKALAQVSTLQRTQTEILAAGATPEVVAAIESAATTLDAVLSSVTGRVATLERYAESVHGADHAFRAHEQIRALSEQAHKYEDLLAATARDDVAIPTIERLSGQATALREVLNESLDTVGRLGSHLRGPHS